MSSQESDNRFVMYRRDKSFKNLSSKTVKTSSINICPVQIGKGASASLENSLAVGCDSTSSGVNSLSLGNNSNASGLNATALGDFANATATSSTSVGTGALSSGFDSTSIGVGSNSSGFGSTTIGALSIASGTSSIALGTQANAASNYLAVGSSGFPLNKAANTVATTSHHLYLRVNNESKLYAVQLIQTNIDA